MESDGANGTSFVGCSMSRNKRRDSHRIEEVTVEKRR